MNFCAQTNAELFVQILQRGGSSAELCLVRDAYGLAMQLYSGVYTGSGKPTLAHEVGAASLAHRHGGSFELVAAGLLHGAYLVGDWGHYNTRLTSKKRQTLQKVIGPRAESYVYGFTMLPWDLHSIAALAERPAAFTEFERNVVFLRLAEELDHLLGFGAVLWFRNAEKAKETLRERRAHYCRLANRIELPLLSAELEQAIDLTLTTELPAELLGLEFPGDAAQLLIPWSCQKRRLLSLSRTLSRAATRLSRGVRRRQVPIRGLVKRALRAFERRAEIEPVVRLVREGPGSVFDNQLLRERNVLVTGAGCNIGRSIAIEMAQQGASIYFTDIDATAVSRLQSELVASGARARGFVSDVSKPADVEELCAALLADGIVVDVLVNNAGINRGGHLQTLELADLHAVFATNVFGPLQLTQHVIRALIAEGRPGSVLFITSVHDRTTLGTVAYSASKAALAMVVRELALELAPHQIRVNGIAPGAVRVNEQGDLPATDRSPLFGSHIHPSYIGRAAVYLAADYFSQFTTGSVLTVDAGMLARFQDQ